MYYLNRTYRSVVFVADDGDNTEADLTTYLQQLDELVGDYHKNGHRAVLVGDTRFTRKPPTPLARQRLGSWLTQNAGRIREISVGVVFIIPSPVMRGALTALGWVGALPPNMNVVADFKDALTKAQILLFNENLPFHQELARADAERRALGVFLDKQGSQAVRAV